MKIHIDKEEVLKGYINKLRSGYRTYFRNTIQKKDEYIGHFTEFKEAYEAYCSHQINFYIKHKYLLPKCVSIDEKNCIYKFAVTITDKFDKRKTHHFNSAKSLQEVTEYRKQFIANLL